MVSPPVADSTLVPLAVRENGLLHLPALLESRPACAYRTCILRLRNGRQAGDGPWVRGIPRPPWLEGHEQSLKSHIRYNGKNWCVKTQRRGAALFSHSCRCGPSRCFCRQRHVGMPTSHLVRRATILCSSASVPIPEMVSEKGRPQRQVIYVRDMPFRVLMLLSRYVSLSRITRSLCWVTSR